MKDSPMDSRDVRNTSRKYALQNAYMHSGTARLSSVVSGVLAERTEWRPYSKQIIEHIKDVVNEVNALTPEQQRQALEENWPELLTAKKREPAEEKRLPPLSNAPRYETIVTRFSPNPDCVLHIGSARAIVLSAEYAKQYRGVFCLRFEDTDPKVKKPSPEFYGSIREDIRWLGYEWGREEIQSDRLLIYYEYAEKLLAQGDAYVCVCSRENFRHSVANSQPCPCRDINSQESLTRWRGMLNGEYSEETAVVRVKTDLHHPNPAVREWPALRVIDTKRSPHPRVGDKYRVWPLYNFSTGVDDHLLGITHIIRGKEHLTNEQRQRYVYRHFGWSYPETIHYGRLKIPGASLSKSIIKLGVEKNEYHGYDDPRLPTFMSLRRRGITPDAIRMMILDVGINPIDVTLSWETLYAYNRKILDPVAKRFFFVDDPLLLRIHGVRQNYTAKLVVHPQHKEWGERIITVTPVKDIAEVLLSRRDLAMLKPQGTFRLMGLFNFTIQEIGEDIVETIFHSESYEEARKLSAPLLHFLSKEGVVKTTVTMPTREKLTGLAEEQCLSLHPGDTIQFERFGFVRIDKLNGTLHAYYAHR